MTTFNIVMTQKLNDGDTALREEHTNVDIYDIDDIIHEYGVRCQHQSYVEGYTVVVTINR